MKLFDYDNDEYYSRKRQLEDFDPADYAPEPPQPVAKQFFNCPEGRDPNCEYATVDNKCKYIILRHNVTGSMCPYASGKDRI